MWERRARTFAGAAPTPFRRRRPKRPPDALRAPAAYGLAAAVLVFAADQASKLWVLAAATGLPVEIAPFFNIVLVWNRGVSFGMFGSTGPLVLAALAAAVAVALVVWMLRSPRRFEALALGAVAGGAGRQYPRPARARRCGGLS